MLETIKWDGKPISVPGMYHGIDIDIYHSAGICDGHSISSSGLRKMMEPMGSPAHFFAKWRGNPKAKEEKPSRALIVGRAAHHLFLKHLDQAKFSDRFAIQPSDYEAEKTGEVKKWNNNAGECKRWHADRKEEGRDVITIAEAEMIVAMAAALDRDPFIATGVLNGLVERSMFWKDERTGIWLKSRPDSIPADSGDFVDFKTTESVQWRSLTRSIDEWSYYQQGALTISAARVVLEMDNPTFTLVFQEKEDPYCIRGVTLDDEDLDKGYRLNRIAIDRFAKGLKTGHWPGPGGDHSDAEKIRLSDAARERIDKQLQAERPMQ